MRTCIIIFTFFVVAGIVTACGVKGPLSLPDDKEKSSPTTYRYYGSLHA